MSAFVGLHLSIATRVRIHTYVTEKGYLITRTASGATRQPLGPPVSSAWSVLLEAGDHIVVLEAHGLPTAVIEVDPAGVFVAGVGAFGHGLAAWRANGVLIDPKDPWPIPKQIIAVAEPSASWFRHELPRLVSADRPPGDATVDAPR
jgi:hypothetical protein